MEIIGHENELNVQRNSPCHEVFVIQDRQTVFFLAYFMVKNNFRRSYKE